MADDESLDLLMAALDEDDLDTADAAVEQTEEEDHEDDDEAQLLAEMKATEERLARLKRDIAEREKRKKKATTTTTSGPRPTEEATPGETSAAVPRRLAVVTPSATDKRQAAKAAAATAVSARTASPVAAVGGASALASAARRSPSAASMKTTEAMQSPAAARKPPRSATVAQGPLRKSAAGPALTPSTTPSSQHVEKAVTKEPFSGLSLRDRKIASDTMEDAMRGRKLLKLGQVVRHLESNTSSSEDFVAIGVLVDRGRNGQTATGKPYTKWRLSDLDQEELDVMIFGDVFQEHWRNRAGTVIGVLNPRLLESRGDGQKKLSPAVTIDNASMVLAIGLCPDFGICAGTRRDGHACTMPINRAVGNYCKFHVAAAYKKEKGKGKAVSAREEKVDNKPKDKSVMSQIKHELKTGTAIGVLAASSSYARKAIRPNAEARFKQEQKDAERKNGTFGRQSLSAPASASAQQLLGYAQGTTPKLATGCRPGEVITLDFRKEKEKLLEKTRADCAAKAWKRLQQGAADGPRTTQTPRLPPPPVSNFASICAADQREAKVSPAVPPRASKPLPQRNLGRAELGGAKRPSLSANGAVAAQPRPKTAKLSDRYLAEKDSKTARDSILSATSRFAHLQETAEEEQFLEALEHSEKLEKMRDHMNSVTSQEVGAWLCHECKIFTYKQQELCKTKKHQMTYKKRVKKRFFRCFNCQEHITALGVKMPPFPCHRCGVTNWRPASMLREKDTPNDTRNIKVRGTEESFLGSADNLSLSSNRK